MKIKTEIFHSIYIITCEGPSLTPSSVDIFLTAGKVLIQRNQLDILLDLSKVESVTGADLATVFRSLDAIEGHGRLLVCGVNDRDLKLLKMSNIEEHFTLAENRNEALSIIYWEKKNAPKIDKLPPLPPVQHVEESATEGMVIYEIEDDEFEIITNSNPEADLNEDGGEAEEQENEAEEEDQAEFLEEERRKFGRIKSRLIMNGDFIVFCKNIGTGKHYTGVVDNFGPAGLFMQLSPPRISEGDILLLKGRIGKNFKFEEKAVFLRRRREGYVFEFVDLSEETDEFLNQLVASANN